MQRTRHLVFSLALILVTAISVRADEVDDYLKTAMASIHIPGASIAIIKDGSLIKAEAYGLADLENRIPAQPDTVYKIGSVSKQFIAAGIMILVQDRKIAVDDKVSKYLKGTPPTWQAITLRHLLTHTSGLAREAPGFDPYKVQPDIDVIKTAYSLPLQFAPGERWDYCNLGYYALAEIIHEVSGKPWCDLLAERVFAPLNMTSTQVTNVAKIIPKRAKGYVWNTDKYENAEDWLTLRPSGAFLSTVLDMAKWEAALQTDRILKESSKKEMWTPVTLNDGRKYPYGFGWELDDWPADSPVPTGVPMIRHEGTIPGFRAGFSRWPSYGLTLIVLTNRQAANMEALTANIAVRVEPRLRTTPAPTK